MGVGIRNIYRTTAPLSTNTDIVPNDITGLVFAIAAGQIAYVFCDVPFSLGATGGFRFAWSTPAAPTAVTARYEVIDCTTANTLFAAAQTVLADFTNASAVAGNYLGRISLEIENGATAGNVSLQFAQNNSTGNNITILRGSVMEVVYM